jgi:ABC-type molybdate transport system ATPase subunit
MIIFVGDLEDCRAIESRLNHDFAPLSVLAPQFQLPAVFVLPVLIQINQKRETPNETGRVSHVAVDVNIELSAPRDTMVSASLQVRVGQQLPNSRNL